RHQRAGGFRVLPLGVFQERHLQKERRGYVNLAGDKGQDPGRRVSDDGILDAVEIGPALLPVLRVPGDPDHLVGLELDKFEGASADRMRADVARRYWAGLDRRKPRGEQYDKG